MLEGLCVIYLSDLYSFDIEAQYPEKLKISKGEIGANINIHSCSGISKFETIKIFTGEKHCLTYCFGKNTRRIIFLIVDEVEDLDRCEKEFKNMVEELTIIDYLDYKFVLKEYYKILLKCLT